MVKIDSLKFGEITIDGKTYYSDVVVAQDGKVYLIEKTHQFSVGHLEMVLKGGSPIVVIGTGMQGMVKVLPEVKQICKDAKIRLYSDPTEKAVEFFNGLIAQGKKTAGYFHVTS